MARRRGESTFLSELKRSHQAVNPGCLWHKIADTPVYDNGKDSERKMRFTLPKPCDVMTGVPGMAIAIEGKYHNGTSPWPLGSVSKNQHANLAAAINSGYESFVALRYRLSGAFDLVRLIYYPMVNSLIDQGLKSLPMMFVKHELYEVPKIKILDNLYWKLDIETFRQAINHGTSTRQENLFN